MTGSANGEPERVDFIDEVLTRSELLELLDEESRAASSLERELDMSRSTIHRATQSLTGFGLLRKNDGALELTGLGRVVADEIDGVRTRLAVARRLEPFLNTIDSTAVDLPLEAFADASVTQPTSRQVHVAAKRIIDLIQSTDSLRMFCSVISPLYVDAALREIRNNTEIEVVVDRDIVELIGGRYAEKAREAFETGRFRMLVADEVPFELFLFDDRIGMAAHDDSGVACAFVESPAPDAREWTEAVYREYVAEADRIDADDV